MQRIALKVAAAQGLNVKKLVERQKHVVQRDADRQHRLSQQYGALAVHKTDHTGPILLIDDIYTTGGILRAATQRLK